MKRGSMCVRNLRGRLVLNKGDKPYTLKEIEDKLKKQWKTAAPWTLLSLGRGYYEFFFANESDMQTVWAVGTINLKPGVLRLFEWTADFDMYDQRNTHAQVWIRLMALPQEYWMEQTLREIASAVGMPLLLDNATLKRLFEHYARILVDIDFSKRIFHEIIVEKEGASYPVEVVYERIPDFCSHCQTLGHDVPNCRWLYPRKDVMSKDKVAKGKTQIPATKPHWVLTNENPSGIGSSKAFAEPIILAETQKSMTAAAMPTTAAPAQQQTSPRVFEDIPQEPVQPVLELVDDVHDDVLSDDVEHVNSEPHEELEIPRIQNAHEIHPSSDTHVYEHSLTVDLEASASAREISPTQLDSDDAHDDMQYSPHDGPLVVRSIPDDTATFLEMERIAQNVNYTVEHTRTDENGDKILIVFESHSNPNVQHDLNLWMRVCEYDKANAELPFTPVLSKKQKQQVRKQLQIGKATTI